MHSNFKPTFRITFPFQWNVLQARRPTWELLARLADRHAMCPNIQSRDRRSAFDAATETSVRHGLRSGVRGGFALRRIRAKPEGGAPDASLDAAYRFLDRGCGEIVVEFEAQREHLARTEMHGVHLVWRPSTQREHARARQRAALGSPGRLKAPASGSRVENCSRLPWKGKEQRWRRSLKGRFWRKAALRGSLRFCIVRRHYASLIEFRE